ncbi:XrtA-associated tyrosine autokinase [Geobacter sp. SVR]|uniref:XrtA-associated tyrosine autokinase n=1 Tax=Geobacter sp. SVR TaxID=2495594 RepID=UPI00143F00EB|nr:XrtA-associated tyrosine autokinase [Geobacter sp. SVR]BCS54985.1 polysaccharide biosynthesis protein [Geobacter sp. SVR]GCF85167.1 polysaccharide biosynthesis protein [Geobacter sp. SVR]
MSRIEEALEKAAKLRNGVTLVAVPEKADQRTHLPPPATESLQVDNMLMVSVTDALAPAAEEYRKLKSIIVKLTKGEEFRNMLMVTSSIASEGKSITSLNLAMSLAQEFDHTVLLVDADIRRSSIHNYLGIENRVGLAECVLDGLDPKKALVRTGIGRLSVLPAGRQVSNPAEVFSSRRFREFLLEMKNRYRDRYVIIDTPPVLPFAETRSLSAIVDGVVLVVKEGRVTLDNINETIECLKGSNLLGVVYNEAAKAPHADLQQYYRQDAA